MSTKNKFTDKEAIYFIIGTVVDWVDVFTRNIYWDILIDSLRFCQKNQGLKIHAWVMMPNPAFAGRQEFSHDLFIYK